MRNSDVPRTCDSDVPLGCATRTCNSDVRPGCATRICDSHPGESAKAPRTGGALEACSSGRCAGRGSGRVHPGGGTCCRWALRAGRVALPSRRFFYSLYRIHPFFNSVHPHLSLSPLLVPSPPNYPTCPPLMKINSSIVRSQGCGVGGYRRGGGGPVNIFASRTPSLSIMRRGIDSW